ncbi:MAG: hypothetical protein IKQ82_03395 [Lentisphaeria bacterium]|nr:hypothetical protein [Lentisphaeria bacterium]
MQSFVLTLIPAAVIVAIAHFTAGALFRPDPEKANPKNLRAKILVVDLLAALVAIAVVQLAAGGLLKPEPPATVETLMTKMEPPASASVGELRDVVRDNFTGKFAALYGIDLEPVEEQQFEKLLAGVDGTFDFTPYLRLVMEGECIRRRIPESVFVRQVLLIRDPKEEEQMRSEWVAAARGALMQSNEFQTVMEPVYREFYDWWTARHPEYEGLTAPVSVGADHDGLLEQVAVSLRREILVQTAKQMQTTFVTDLRKRGVAISEAKLRKAFLLFLVLCKERYTQAAMLKTANAIVDGTGLTDDEILHCLILKNRPLTDERLAEIQDIQVRYLTPLTLEQVPEESVTAVRRGLSELTGINYELK